MLKFQWRRNGVDIPRATDHLMVLGAATVEDEGTYTCAVSNRQGDTVIWEESVLHVASPPIVKSDFSHILVLPGDSISLGVHVSCRVTEAKISVANERGRHSWGYFRKVHDIVRI